MRQLLQQNNAFKTLFQISPLKITRAGPDQTTAETNQTPIVGAYDTLSTH